MTSRFLKQELEIVVNLLIVSRVVYHAVNNLRNPMIVSLYIVSVVLLLLMSINVSIFYNVLRFDDVQTFVYFTI